MEKEISRTKIKSHLRKKTSPELAETIKLALKNKNWLPIAKILSSSTRKFSSVNLSEIDEKTSAGDTIVVLGKILSSGDISKKIRISALGISSKALEKLRKSKSSFVQLKEEIKSNPKAEGIKLIK